MQTCPGACPRDMSALAVPLATGFVAEGRAASALACLAEGSAGRAAVRVELDRPPELPCRGDVVADHLLVVATELVPSRRVQGLELDGLHVELTCPRDLPPRLLRRGPGLERLDRERIKRVSALRSGDGLLRRAALDLGVRVVDPPRRNPRGRDRVEP